MLVLLLFGIIVAVTAFMTKIILLTTLLLSVNTAAYFSSCNPCRDVKPIVTCVRVEDVHLSAADTSGKILADSDSLYWRSLELNLKIYMTTICSRESVNSFFNSAIACSPIERVDTTGSVLYLSIISNNDFDATHPAGSKLNEYFTVPSIGSINGSRYGAIHDLRLLQAPSDTGTHVFTVTLNLVSGDEKSAETVAVKLVK